MASLPAMYPASAAIGTSKGPASVRRMGELHRNLAFPHRSELAYTDSPVHLPVLQASPEAARPGERKECQSRYSNTTEMLLSCGGLSSLPGAIPTPPLMPSHNSSNFWGADGSFKCDWAALKSGEAFCSFVKAACPFCLSRALGGPSKLTSALLERLRVEAKVAIEDEVARLIQSVKKAAGESPRPEGSNQPVATTETTQQLMEHPALQAVAFLSVHERRLAVFEIWLDRWQVLSRGYQCTCGSAEAADEALMKIASENATKTSMTKGVDTKAALEAMTTQVARLREEARNAQQEEEATVSEAQKLSVELVTKQQQLLQVTERVKALKKIRSDPTVKLMQRAHQQQTTPATAESITASQKEPFWLIAEKCSKLANLARVMQQQQFIQPPKGALIRHIWEVYQARANTQEGGASEEGGIGLLGDLRGLQTPHASLHSPRSQRARISSHLASPVAPPKQPPITRARENTLDEFEERINATANGENLGFPLIRATGPKGTGEPADTPLRVGRVASPSPSAGHKVGFVAEAESSKRRRGIEELEAARRRRAHPLRVVNAELDLDGDAATLGCGRDLRKETTQDAIWVDSFLGRRPEMS